jgi:hypothetical protein
MSLQDTKGNRYTGKQVGHYGLPVEIEVENNWGSRVKVKYSRG